MQTSLTPDEVRDRLRQRLDRARLPDRIVHIDAVPLTANGKPDRKAAELLVRAHDSHPCAQPTRQPAQTRTSHEPVAV